MKTIHKMRCLTALVLCCVLPLTGFATNTVARDSGVLASKAGDTNQAKVISRLKKVGDSEAEAIGRVDKMTDGEIEYFAQHPESIKRTGFIILASLIGSSVYTSINNANKKREAYIAHLDSKIAGFRMEITLLDSKRMNQSTLLFHEPDPANKAKLEADIDRYEKEIASKEDQIKSLQSDINAIRTKKKKVPNKKDW
jgi:chromosome segregation ATPase